MKLSNHTRVLCLTALAVLASTTAEAQKLYKWVDAQGNISYQDQPPPQDGKLLDEKPVTQSASSSSEPANTDPIKVYTVDDCAMCAQAVLALIRMGVPHVELPLNDDRDAQSLILEKTSKLIAPSIIIGDDILQSPSNDDLKQAVKDAGYAVPE